MGDVDALIVAVQKLPELPESLFGAVATPTPHEVQAFLQCVAAELQAIAALLERLEAVQLGLEAWLPSASAGVAVEADRTGEQAAELVGSLRIEELGRDAASAAAGRATCARVLLALALYGPEPESHVECVAGAGRSRLWAVPPASTAATSALQLLAGKLAGLGSLEDGAERHEQRQQQELVVAALPDLLQLLRPIILAKHRHESSDQTRLDPYNGPEAFERSLAASQLSWLLRQLGGRQLVHGSWHAALPCVLAACNDPSPAAQAQGLWALHHLATVVAAAELSWQRELLLDTARRSVAGVDDAAWPAAAATAVALALKLDGMSPAATSASYSGVLEALLEEAERSGHVAGRARVWLETAPALFPPLGLHLVRHLARLMPLLRRWCTMDRLAAGSNEVRRLALRATHAVVLQTWPRMPAHARAVWGVLAAAYAIEAAPSSSSAAGSSSCGQNGTMAGAAGGAAPGSARHAAVACGLALWHLGAVDFQHELLARPQGSGALGHELLLEAVMERVEQDSSMGDASNGGIEPGEAQAAGRDRAQQDKVVLVA